ncbi:SOS response-associated peptidase [Corynebacterium uropygiale]|uniref:Abasic site processing protein n=1 Tax=Corynebacterium uropygiale TaxID=1775911 RepID=A0A9X1U6U9_9CORY|nr:SOS response-associated peptidase [Corynebacterium uropygiale]MCF4006082.1 SOS response-associated peptidase [Corynebacterium uropygiale]
MCGRFVLFQDEESLRHSLDALPGVTETLLPEGAPPPRYNIAPTTTVAAVDLSQPGRAILAPARWGLIPEWKKEISGPPLFNARSETVQDKPSFRGAFARSRCLVPMDGYYEWKDKQPHFVSLRKGGLLWAAGLYSTALGQLSVTILTTQSQPPLEWLHHRMPRFLQAEEMETWTRGTPQEAAQLLHPSLEPLREQLRTWPVGREVGRASIDHAGLITPVDAD